jgi:hypothetical protein
MCYSYAFVEERVVINSRCVNVTKVAVRAWRPENATVPNIGQQEMIVMFWRSNALH